MPEPTSSSSQSELGLHIQSDPATLADTRKRIEAFASAAGLDEPACHDLGLCVNEALANVIRHAYSGATDRPIEIHASAIDSGVKVTIRDWGNGVNPADMPQKRKDPNTPGGLGMICLRQMVNEANFIPQEDGMLLELVKKRG